jgi:cytoskeletal protein RodZ
MSPNLGPQSYGYGSPYPGTTPRSSSGGMRWFWILAAVGVVAVLVLVGGIAAYAARQFSHDDLTVPSPTETSSAATPTGRAPSTRPSTGKTHAPSSGPSPSATEPAGQPVIVSGINEVKTIACAGNASITVSGISNTVTLTGHCGSVTVSGLNNVITVDAADTIEATGLNNKVTYHSGSPKINKTGSGNTVEQG